MGRAGKQVLEIMQTVYCRVNHSYHTFTPYPVIGIILNLLKFFTRFRYIEKALAAQGRDTAGATLDEMEALWQEAKTAK